MNFPPTFFNQQQQQGLYVIIETDPDIAFTQHSYKVIGACMSYNNAMVYSGSNRIIKGPIPLLDTAMPQKYPNPDMPPTFYPYPNPYPLPPMGPAMPRFDPYTPQPPVQPSPNPFHWTNPPRRHDRMDTS